MPKYCGSARRHSSELAFIFILKGAAICPLLAERIDAQIIEYGRFYAFKLKIRQFDFTCIVTTFDGMSTVSVWLVSVHIPVAFNSCKSTINSPCT